MALCEPVFTNTFFLSLHTSKNHRHGFTMAEQRERALSETMAHIFIAILVIIATLLIIALLTGVMTKMLQKPALFSVQANQFDTTDGMAHIISLFHQQGDPVNLNGTSQNDGVSIVSFSLDTPSDGVVRLRYLGTSMSKNAWHAGETLYIYKSVSGYGFSEIAPTGAAVDLGTGTWTINIQDDKVQVLLHSLSVTIK
jgi:hypothetical protein